MAGRKRRTYQAEPNPRHLEWANMVLRGHSYRAIAAQYDVSHSAVFKAVRRVEELQRPELADERMRIKHAVTGRLNWVLAEASTAFERSKEPIVTEETDENGIVRRRTVTSSGDARFLREFRAANAELVDLWGVQSAIQHEQDERVSIKAGIPTDEELEEHIAAIRRQHDRSKRMRAKMDEEEREDAEARRLRTSGTESA